MIKELALILGTLVGAALTVFGAFIVLKFRADNTDADAVASGCRYFFGIPCLVVGLLLAGLCLWGNLS